MTYKKCSTCPGKANAALLFIQFSSSLHYLSANKCSLQYFTLITDISVFYQNKENINFAMFEIAFEISSAIF